MRLPVTFQTIPVRGHERIKTRRNVDALIVVSHPPDFPVAETSIFDRVLRVSGTAPKKLAKLPGGTAVVQFVHT